MKEKEILRQIIRETIKQVFAMPLGFNDQSVYLAASAKAWNKTMDQGKPRFVQVHCVISIWVRLIVTRSVSEGCSGSDDHPSLTLRVTIDGRPRAHHPPPICV